MLTPVHYANQVLLAVKATDHPNTWTSDSFCVNPVVFYSIHTVITAGTLRTGTYTIEASNDGTNFTVVDTQSVTTGALSYLYNPGFIGYSWVRVKYVSTAGTGGTINVVINAKTT